jgi:spermidine synthase
MLILTVIFILSGAAGLIYESIWSRYLGLFVGHSAYAQVVVLVIFMGGLSLGAYLAGELSSRRRRPLRDYAYIELVAGLIGFAFHFGYVQVTELAYDQLYPALSGGAGVSLAKWTISAALILPQSILLGATFPLMSAAAIRLFPGRPGRDLSLLYFGNSFGAAIGVLLAGFVLLRIGGLPGTLATAGTINILVFGAAMLAERHYGRGVANAAAVRHERPASVPDEPDRYADPRPAPRKKSRKAARRAAREAPAAQPLKAFPPLTSPDAPLAAAAPSPVLLPRLWVALLAVSFGTAVASFIYEIAWVRMLSLVLGSATHSFELMLSAFIMGLALGSFAIRKYVDRIRRPVLALGIIQWVMGLLALATLPLYAASFDWMGAFYDRMRVVEHGYQAFIWGRYALCLLIMLPATFFAGMTLPLITRTLLVAGAGERAIGRVYAINTLGAIIGVILAALVLMPLLGLRLLLATGALADMAIGAALLWPAIKARVLPHRRLIYAGAAAGVAFVVGTLALVRLDHALLTRGVFRVGGANPDPRAEIVFYRDGRTATVSVRGGPQAIMVTLATNGKPDASIEGSWLYAPPPAQKRILRRDNATQVLLPVVTLAYAPHARYGAVIGQGSGMSSHFLLGSPNLTELATIEIEPQMVAGSRAYYPLNSRVFDDPRSRVVIDDAKSYFAASPRKYDLILSEPSNPWVSGTSSLFTIEFYQRIRRHLAPGGILGQWLHLYESNDDMIMSVLAALDRVFADYEVFWLSPGDILIVARADGPLPAPDWTVVDFPLVAEDLAHVRVPGSEAFERLRIGGRDVFHPVAAMTRPNSDYHPILDLAAEPARFWKTRARGFWDLTERWFDLPAVLEDRQLGFSTDTVASLPEIPRVRGAAFGARLRLALGGNVEAALATPEMRRELAEVLSTHARLERLAESGQPPDDWRDWLGAVALTDWRIHFGTAGVTDDAFTQRMIGYAMGHGAPRELIAALEYVRGMRAWDFAPVIRYSEILEAAHRSGTPWLSPDALRDASVVAYLRAGDVTRARERLERLTPLADPADVGFRFRTRLLEGAVREAERRGCRSGA